MAIEIVPCTVKKALKYVKEWHRHLPKLQGGLFAVGLADRGEIVGVGICGNPARVWQGTGKVVVSRLAIMPGFEITKNGCSRIYGALCRAAKALGYKEVWTYTLLEEPGTSLRAAGFEHMGLSRVGTNHGSKDGRQRGTSAVEGKKNRWRRIL